MDGAAGVKPLPQEQPRPGESEYLKKLLRKPLPKVPAEVVEAIDSGPFDPVYALDRDHADRLCDPAPLAVENGWTRLPDKSVQIGVRTPMPDLTPEMVECWFDWHSRRDDRYRVWHPDAHFRNDFAPADSPGRKPSWGVINYPEEDVGDGRIRIRIRFESPREFGFSDDYLEDPLVGTILCARVGDRWVSHTDMAHVFLREKQGLVLRSRFWIARRVRPQLPQLISFAEGPLESVASRRIVRQLAIPDAVGHTLARHCAEEYTNLNEILPGLYERFGDR